MDEYPVKPYKATLLEKSTTITMNGKHGKVVEATYCNLHANIVKLSIISNKGKIKDIIELPIEDVLALCDNIPHWQKAWTKEDE